jgi:hypothetical protein
MILSLDSGREYRRRGGEATTQKKGDKRVTKNDRCAPRRKMARSGFFKVEATRHHISELFNQRHGMISCLRPPTRYMVRGN